MWQLASDLKSMDIVEKDEDIATTDPCGVPEKIQHLIVAANTLTTDRQLSMDLVKSRLL